MATQIFETLHNSNVSLVGFLEKIKHNPASTFDGKARAAFVTAKVRSPGQVVVVDVKFDDSFILQLSKLEGHFVLVPVTVNVFNGKPYYKAFDLPVSLHKEYMAEYPPISIPLDQAA